MTKSKPKAAPQPKGKGASKKNEPDKKGWKKSGADTLRNVKKKTEKVVIVEFGKGDEERPVVLPDTDDYEGPTCCCGCCCGFNTCHRCCGDCPRPTSDTWDHLKGTNPVLGVCFGKDRWERLTKAYLLMLTISILLVTSSVTTVMASRVYSIILNIVISVVIATPFELIAKLVLCCIPPRECFRKLVCLRGVLGTIILVLFFILFAGFAIGVPVWFRDQISAREVVTVWLGGWGFDVLIKQPFFSCLAYWLVSRKCCKTYRVPGTGYPDPDAPGLCRCRAADEKDRDEVVNEVKTKAKKGKESAVAKKKEMVEKHGDKVKKQFTEKKGRISAAFASFGSKKAPKEDEYDEEAPEPETDADDEVGEDASVPETEDEEEVDVSVEVSV